MSRYIKDGTGKLLKFADKFMKMANHIYNEGIYYLRVKAGGGTVTDREMVEDIYKVYEENNMLDNIRVGVLAQAGGVQRTSGIYRFFSRLFNIGLSGVKYNATQLVTNGNFANGTTGWQPTLVDGFTVIGGVGEFTFISGGGFIGKILSGRPDAASSKVYYLARIKSDSATTYVQAYDGVGTSSSAVHTGDNTFQNLSVIRTHVSTSSVYDLRIKTNAPSGWTKTYVDYAMVINLTATFGAGNEPSKEVCDVIFADYFDGTKEVQLNDVTQGIANSQPYLVSGALVNPNGASRFMTHPTVSFAANEAWSVSWVMNSNWGSRTAYYIFGDGAASTSYFGIVSNGVYRIVSAGAGINFGSNGNRIAGKSSYWNLIYNGTGTVSLYRDTVLISSASINGAFNLNSFILGTSASQSLEGSHYLYFIRSGALTPSQITAEYTVLRKYFPEIRTTLIGSKNIATENCQMVATPMGRVINLVNKETATETVLNGSFNTTDNWTIDTANGVYIDTVNGKLVVPTVVLNSYTVVAEQNVASNYAGKLVLVKLVISEYVQGGLNVSPGNSQSIKFPSLGNGTFYGLLNVTTGTNRLVVTRDYYTGFIGKIDELSVREVGWNISGEIYNGIFNSTPGTVEQKTSAALAAAAMWRSPDADHDKQAVFGKLFNGYAAKLLSFDIAAYNTANPTAPWGYDLLTEADEDELGDDANALKIEGTDYWTLGGGTNETGFTALPAGIILADGTYTGFGKIATFWTKDSPNDPRLGASIRLKKV